MKRTRRRSEKTSRVKRQYRKQSDRFTYITCSMGISGLRACTQQMEEIVSSLERAAGDPSFDLDALPGDLERIAVLSGMLEKYLGQVNNSVVRYVNACKEEGRPCHPQRTALCERRARLQETADPVAGTVQPPGHECLEVSE